MAAARTSVIETLFDAGAIARRVGEIAQEIAGKIAQEIDRNIPQDIVGDHDGDLLVIVILKGSFVFAADLIRAFDRAGLDPRIDFLTLSSYAEGTESSGTVQLVRDISEDVGGKHILIVDDILESGRTLDFARRMLFERGAASVKLCVLLDKAEKREIDIEADYVGFTIGDQYVVGYGLDLAHYYRGLPYIGVVRNI